MRRKIFEALFDDFLRFQKASFGGLWTEILEIWSLKPKKSPDSHVCDRRARSTRQIIIPFALANYICFKQHSKHKL